MTQTIPDTMQAAAIDRFGGIDEIKLQTLSVPEVGPGQRGSPSSHRYPEKDSGNEL
ncbi:MAG: hypothetical protein ACREV0_06030 [Burkholderiales bacterium]